jgi:hypothetical protein
MMQPPPHQQPPPQQQQQQQQQPPNQHQPQMSPQLSGGNNYIGQSPPQNAPICNENGSTSDDSDDNALNDPNVSCIYIFHNKDTLMKLQGFYILAKINYFFLASRAKQILMQF